MAETAETEKPVKKSGKGILLVTVVLVLCGMGGGYYASASGLLSLKPAAAPPPDKQDGDGAAMPDALPDVAYVDLAPIIISLGQGGDLTQLRFHAQLEVEAEYIADVEKIKPRIIDVLNGYMRAMDISDLNDPLALMKMRSQMLRRAAIVAGQGRVRDLLVMEFVLN